jgi:hypothetical protein
MVRYAGIWGVTVEQLVRPYLTDRSQKRKDSPATNKGTSNCFRSVSRLSSAYCVLIKSSSLDALYAPNSKKKGACKERLRRIGVRKLLGYARGSV